MKFLQVSMAAAMAAIGLAFTSVAALAGAMGVGADDTLSSQVSSVRSGSSHAGRVYMGGGLHGGK